MNLWAIGMASAGQGEALDGFQDNGVEVKRFPDEVLEALATATDEVFDEESAADPMFKRVVESYQSFSQAYDDYPALSDIE